MADSINEKFFEMAENTQELFAEAFKSMTIVMQDISKSLHAAASQGSDMPVTKDKEEAKRQAIALWRESADHMMFLAQSAAYMPVSGKTLKDEFAKTLLAGLSLWVREWDLGTTAIESLEDLMRERAANLATGFQGRVLPQ